MSKELLFGEDSISLKDLLKRLEGKDPKKIIVQGSWRDYGEYGDTCACIKVYEEIEK